MLTSLFSLFYVTGECCRFQTCTPRSEPYNVYMHYNQQEQENITLCFGLSKKNYSTHKSEFSTVTLFSWKFSFTRRKVDVSPEDIAIRDVLSGVQLFTESSFSLLKSAGYYNYEDYMISENFFFSQKLAVFLYTVQPEKKCSRCNKIVYPPFVNKKIYLYVCTLFS